MKVNRCNSITTVWIGCRRSFGHERCGFDKYIDVKIRFVYACYGNIAAGENQKTSNKRLLNLETATKKGTNNLTLLFFRSSNTEKTV
ncbi:hypothetical protein JMJ77_0006937 [Colletotrichum scovillei]|uniref:Uncharacterized protein n=1 Tax=Colletotrichum scovillei TaxID=1209932 RepID=A0A9P7RBR8_9PEZI|nr:hypothetical protein JMJ77_0006937 [Colletotrichum scovillei]KAG7073897.1 hypothetical protein JMJ76_0010392 [Colletotrichum scovillei]KAG7081443.1 hypothetical protein JMJ78_0003566 [Colletotrichum scovillei]